MLRPDDFIAWRGYMPELRQNMATGEWVVIATERARRPEEFASKREPRASSPHRDDCPFCPGNERFTPGPVFSLPTTGPWEVRAVTNKFAALVPDIPLRRSCDGHFRKATGYGFHQVIIETPRHDLPLALQEPAGFDRVVEAWHRSYALLAAAPGVEFVIPFKNHGEAAGTSLEHPHSQIIGLPIFPGHIRGRMEEAIRFYDAEGECVFCAMVRMERQAGARIVAENDRFTAFIPYAAFSPFHLWIFPRVHQSTFRELDDGGKAGLSTILRTVLRKLHAGLGDPDYNLMVRSGPADAPRLKYFHWYISIVPRLGKAAGFELGSGMYINTALPEESAAYLRAVTA
jgi:UDPglucose--hexose-1-phosphate uridylyltransferase